MDWLKLGAEMAMAVIGAAFGTGLAWGMLRGRLERTEERDKEQADRADDLLRNLTAAHRRLDDAERRVIRLEAQLEFLGRRHDEVSADLRAALLRIEQRLEDLARAQRGTQA